MSDALDGFVARPLRLYGTPSEHDPVDAAWVEGQLRDAGTYWVVLPAAPDQPPHPRPVWGVWNRPQLALSLGSPTLQRLTARNAPITVHLDSGTDVVIVTGVVVGTTIDEAFIDAYNVKYQWSYDVGGYGPLTTVDVQEILAWQSIGWAGRDGFAATAHWHRDHTAS